MAVNPQKLSIGLLKMLVGVARTHAATEDYIKKQTDFDRPLADAVRQMRREARINRQAQPIYEPPVVRYGDPEPHIHQLEPARERPALADTADTAAECRRRLAKELYKLELDLSGGLRIPANTGAPCDCQPGDSLMYVAGDTCAVKTMHDAFAEKTRKVFSHRQLRQTTNHLSRRYSGEMHELNFRYTSFPFRATPEHPLLIAKDAWRWNWRTHGGIKDDQLSWIPAKDVGTNDFIAFPRMLVTKDMEVISPNLAEIIGWYLSEGSKTDNRIVISLGYHEVAGAQRLREIIPLVFGKPAKEYERETGLHLALADQEFTGLFDAFGRDAPTKRLPDWFITLPPEKQGRMLRGLFMGDGCFSGGCLHYATVSKHLAFQIRMVLFRLGIIHGLSITRPRDGMIDGRVIKSNHDLYTINVSGEALLTLNQLIPDLPWKQSGVRAARNHGWVSEGNIFIPLRSRHCVPFEGTVYNVTVADDESYLTPHGAAHNCASSKHSLGVEATAEELMAYDKSNLPSQVIQWYHNHLPQFDPQEIVNHPPEYYHQLVPEVRQFRKQLMGTESLASMLSAGDQQKLQAKLKGMEAQE